MSPPPITSGLEPLIDGKSNSLKPVTGFNGFEDATTAGTKSPSITIAAFGELLKTLLTDVLKSVCSAPDLPPGMLPVSPTILAMNPNAVLTDLSVHLILWADSLSYSVGLAVRR